MDDLRLCFCVLGWHYLDDFYERLFESPLEKHIISHRDESYLVGRALRELVRNDLHVMPNQRTGIDAQGVLHELSDFDNFR